MRNLKQITVACALVLVSGCATLGEMPPPSASGEISICGVEGTRSGQQAMLCDTVRDIRTRSAQYLAHHGRVAGERTAVQGLTLAAGLAGGGFAAFDAHDDNIEAAGILAAGGLLVDRGLNMRTRVDILRSGVLAMNCYASVGVTFANAHSMMVGADSLPTALDNTITSLSENLALGRDALVVPVAAGATPADAAARAALTQAITQGQATLTELIKAQRALSRAPDELERAWRLADTQVLQRLAGARSDMAALVREAQQLSASLASPAPGAGAAPSGARGDGAGSTLTAITADINSDVRDADRIDPGRYIASFEQIAQCKALAAA